MPGPNGSEPPKKLPGPVGGTGGAPPYPGNAIVTGNPPLGMLGTQPGNGTPGAIGGIPTEIVHKRLYTFVKMYFMKIYFSFLSVNYKASCK